jgi:hypothetical protein
MLIVPTNTHRMNIIKPLLEKILPVLEEKLPARFHWRQVRRRKMEIQLEFPWHPKR